MKKSKTQSAVIPVSRPPVVAVLGHVDHGKTTLLDTIRKTHVASKEHGGITQSIGAYQVQLKTQNSKLKSSKDRMITFIDTPGHEAFSSMRSRGANVADIAILVVAADDGVMPQTIESIRQIQSAGIPFIVAVNKIDLPDSNIERIKQDLAQHGVQVEGFGGDVPVCLISAKNGTGVDGLIDLILLVRDMKGLPNEPSASLGAVVIEAKIDKGKGMTASVIVKQGTLSSGGILFEHDKQIAKIRALFDENGMRVSQATPGKPVEVIGFTKLPSIGMVLTDRAVDALAEKQAPEEKSSEMPDFLKPINLEQEKRLKVIVKSDTSGSLEAIIASLDSRIQVVSSAIGPVNDADIMLAKSVGAFIVGFNVRLTPEIEKFALAERVIVRIYQLIYEMLQELSEAAQDNTDILVVERELGTGTVIAEFPYDSVRVAGTNVVSGRLARGDMVHIKRGDTEVGVAKIKTMRHKKEEVNKAESGVQCGIIFDRSIDFLLGDVIIAFIK